MGALIKTVGLREIVISTTLLGWALAYTNARASDAATELDRGGSGVRRRAVP